MTSVADDSVPPDRSAQSPLRVSAAQWSALQIPVEIAFFMFNSLAGRTIVLSRPAGATESALPLDAWRDIVDANPWLRTAVPEVEAVLVSRDEGDDRCRGFIVPIDACYELVGRVRLQWTGISGGEPARAAVDDFFAELSARAGVRPGCPGGAAAQSGAGA